MFAAHINYEFCKIMKKVILFFLSLIFISAAFQVEAQLSGDFAANTNFYIKDTTIGANTSQYKREFSSSEAWLFLNYEISGFRFSVRYDLFNNSPLLDPDEVYTKQGLAFYSVSKKIENFDITVGHFYDQFATGIIFRAFEDRILGIDYAINGVKLGYEFSPEFRVKAFTGRQKNRFDLHPQVIKGINIEKDFLISEKFQMFSGVGLINRTLDQNTMNQLANEINSYKLEDRFMPKYNVFATTIYNKLVYHNVSWYLEYARKTPEAIRTIDGNRFEYKEGKVLYSSMNYSRKGFGVNFTHKRSDGFSMRVSPFTSFLVGTINFMPPMSKQHSRVLPGRYSISALETGEVASQVDITFTPKKNNTFMFNFAHVADQNKQRTFREAHLEYNKRFSRSLNTTVGIQSIFYDKLTYENKLEDAVNTITPFSEIVYRIDQTKSLRSELQYLFTQQDHGDFLFALLEFNIAPKYSFSVSDMINTKPKKLNDIKHYYSFAAFYSHNQNRFGIAYVKQVEGVVCTGGVCRVEPAFNGFKFTVTTSF